MSVTTVADMCQDGDLGGRGAQRGRHGHLGLRARQQECTSHPEQRASMGICVRHQSDIMHVTVRMF